MSIIAGGQRYSIRNSRWPDHHLYASTHGPLTARTWYEDHEQSQWTLKSPPNADSNRPDSYLIHSVRWPDAAMIIEESEACTTHDYCNHGPQDNNVTGDEIENHALNPNNTNMSLPEGYVYREPQMPSDPQAYDDPENFDSLDLGLDLGTQCTHTECEDVQYPLTRNVQGGWLGWGADPPMPDLLMQFERAPQVHQQDDYQLVMIKNSYNHYLYMPTWGLYGFAGWGTRAYPEDPGFGGYWYFDPPLPAEVWDAMPSYSGRTCDFECGRAGDIRYVSSAPLLTGGSATLLSLGLALVMAE